MVRVSTVLGTMVCRRGYLQSQYGLRKWITLIKVSTQNISKRVLQLQEHITFISNIIYYQWVFQNFDKKKYINSLSYSINDATTRFCV